MGERKSVKDVIADIEALRVKLNSIVESKGVNSREVVEISEELDNILVRFIKISNKSKED
jgi:hypothetical protein